MRIRHLLPLTLVVAVACSGSDEQSVDSPLEDVTGTSADLEDDEPTVDDSLLTSDDAGSEPEPAPDDDADDDDSAQDDATAADDDHNGDGADEPDQPQDNVDEELLSLVETDLAVSQLLEKELAINLEVRERYQEDDIGEVPSGLLDELADLATEAFFPVLEENLETALDAGFANLLDDPSPMVFMPSSHDAVTDDCVVASGTLDTSPSVGDDGEFYAYSFVISESSTNDVGWVFAGQWVTEDPDRNWLEEACS